MYFPPHTHHEPPHPTPHTPHPTPHVAHAPPHALHVLATPIPLRGYAFHPSSGTLNSDGEVTPTATPMPMSAHVLGIAQFLNGIAFGSMVSMTAVSLGAKVRCG